MHLNRRRTLVFSIIAGLAASASAWGQANPMFENMDANHDGRISLQEHAAVAKATFARMDANHDGQLTAAELDAAHRAAVEGPSADARQPGAKTAEDAAVAQALFNRLDINHDGVVSTIEMQAAHTRKGVASTSAPAADQHRGLGGMGALLDANHDGFVSTVEYAATARARFAHMDSNHDGFVSRPEMDAAHPMQSAPASLPGH
ncbi:MAG: hypothetical protein JWL98_1852 [Xanthomonadaceae bacterium]|nr:hypothetical protein [Xanthomonadaceae bacterium]